MHLSKRIFFTALVFIFFQPAAFSEWTTNSMMQVKLVNRVVASPDGKKIAYSVEQFIKINGAWRDSQQIFLTDRRTRKTIQLTHEKNKAMNPEFSPDGKYIAYISTGKNNSALKIISSEGGDAWTLIPSKATIETLQWSPDGNKIAFTKEIDTSKPPLPQPVIFSFTHVPNNNLWVAELNTQKKLSKQPEKITQYSKQDDPGKIGAMNWSPDNLHLAFIRFSPRTDAYWASGTLMLLDVKTKKIHQLFKEKMPEHAPQFSPDGKSIAFLGSTRVYVVSAKGGTPKPLTLTPDQLPQNLIGWSADGKHVYAQEYYHTYDSILALSTDGKDIQIINPKNKLIEKISLNASHTLFAFNMQDSNHAEEVFVSKLSPFKPIQISSVNANAPKFPLGITKVIQWHSKDGRIIQGLLTYPVGFKKNNGRRYPLLVENHGGPGFVFQQYYIARRSVYPIAIFSAQGYLYFRPNIRGSSGYGPAFRESIHKDWGGADFQDVMSGVQHLIDIGIADPNRLGILGWSFGGYMGTWAVTQTHRFKAACVGGAITDLISYAGTTDLAKFIPNAFGSYFWDDAKLYLERSPIMHVKNVTTPTLLLNGLLDYRVPHTQSEEFYRALKLRGIPTELVLYPNTYHPIRIPYLVFDAANRNIAWMNKYIKNNPDTTFSEHRPK